MSEKEQEGYKRGGNRLKRRERERRHTKDKEIR